MAYSINVVGPQDQIRDTLRDDMPSPLFLSQAFYDEAFCLVYRDGYPQKLPDVQALGMLSLYKVSCGDMPGALEMAEGFSQAATTLCLQQPHAAYDDQLCRVQAMTYCGAITLVR